MIKDLSIFPILKCSGYWKIYPYFCNTINYIEFHGKFWQPSWICGE